MPFCIMHSLKFYSLAGPFKAKVIEWDEEKDTFLLILKQK